jgi:hypothetical protein
MIKVNNINGMPEETPEGNFAVHSDSNFFYFFIDEQERIQYFQDNGISYNPFIY